VITPDWHPGSKPLRQFSVGALVVFGLLAAGLWHRTGSVRAAAVPAVLGVTIFLVGLASPAAVRPAYRLLALVGLPIAWVVSEVSLRLVFYGVLTPLGLILRMTARDPLRLRRRAAPSYWRDAKRDRSPSSYFRQA
jgi:hypothetical protein